MMSRRAVYEALGGYDESLSYEDFDFWVRSARAYRYFFLDEVLTLKRRVAGSHSTQFYNRRHNPHLASTLEVCRKAYQLNRTPVAHPALARARNAVSPGILLCSAAFSWTYRAFVIAFL